MVIDGLAAVSDNIGGNAGVRSGRKGKRRYHKRKCDSVSVSGDGNDAGNDGSGDSGGNDGGGETCHSSGSDWVRVVLVATLAMMVAGVGAGEVDGGGCSNGGGDTGGDSLGAKPKQTHKKGRTEKEKKIVITR